MSSFALFRSRMSLTVDGQIFLNSYQKRMWIFCHIWAGVKRSSWLRTLFVLIMYG